MTFKLFRHKSNGVVEALPDHYLEHPSFGFDLEPYDPDEYEEDKVVVEDHELPVDQRITRVATPLFTPENIERVDEDDAPVEEKK